MPVGPAPTDADPDDDDGGAVNQITAPAPAASTPMTPNTVATSPRETALCSRLAPVASQPEGSQCELASSYFDFAPSPRMTDTTSATAPAPPTPSAIMR